MFFSCFEKHNIIPFAVNIQFYLFQNHFKKIFICKLMLKRMYSNRVKRKRDGPILYKIIVCQPIYCCLCFYDIDHFRRFPGYHAHIFCIFVHMCWPWCVWVYNWANCCSIILCDIYVFLILLPGDLKTVFFSHLNGSF